MNFISIIYTSNPAITTENITLKKQPITSSYFSRQYPTAGQKPLFFHAPLVTGYGQDLIWASNASRNLILGLPRLLLASGRIYFGMVYAHSSLDIQ